MFHSHWNLSVSLYSDSKWMNTPQQEQLLEVFFKDSPIAIDWDFHGTQKVESNKLIFGPWAGPERCITNLIHEMGHLAEIDDARILQHGWGLTTPELYIPGRYSHMAAVPKTWQPIQRECRVMAMQWHIQNLLGIEETPREVVKSLKWMPDWCNLPLRRYDGTTPGEFPYAEYEESRLMFVENTMLEFSRGKFSLKFFREEWKRKNELLKQAK